MNLIKLNVRVREGGGGVTVSGKPSRLRGAIIPPGIPPGGGTGLMLTRSNLSHDNTAVRVREPLVGAGTRGASHGAARASLSSAGRHPTDGRPFRRAPRGRPSYRKGGSLMIAVPVGRGFRRRPFTDELFDAINQLSEMNMRVIAVLCGSTC